MTALTRWNPFQELEQLEDRFASLFGRLPLRRADERESMTLAQWAPLVDIAEDENEYLIKAELPGVDKKDVKVTLENGDLMISGERKSEKEEKGKTYHRVERVYGSFTRSFSLPTDADPNKIDARFKEGVLEVHVAKGEHAKPKQIEVKAG